METTIFKRVKGSTMEEIFDNSQVLSVRWFEIVSPFDEKDWNPDTKYKYRVVVRHPEETDANQLFDQEIKRVEKVIHTTPTLKGVRTAKQVGTTDKRSL